MSRSKVRRRSTRPHRCTSGSLSTSFFTEHFRQRQLFGCIERVAAARNLDRGLVGEMLDFLRNDISLHLLDEEDTLFLLMRQRCPSEEDIEQVLSALPTERTGSRDLAVLVIAGLEMALAEARPIAAQSSLRKAMINFVRRERRHLALENSIMLLLLPAGALWPKTCRSCRPAWPRGVAPKLRDETKKSE